MGSHLQQRGCFSGAKHLPNDVSMSTLTTREMGSLLVDISRVFPYITLSNDYSLISEYAPGTSWIGPTFYLV